MRRRNCNGAGGTLVGSSYVLACAGNVLLGWGTGQMVVSVEGSVQRSLVHGVGSCLALCARRVSVIVNRVRVVRLLLSFGSKRAPARPPLLGLSRVCLDGWGRSRWSPSACVLAGMPPLHVLVQRVSRRGVHLGRPCPPMHSPPCYIHYHSLRATALLHIRTSTLTQSVHHARGGDGLAERQKSLLG